MVKAKRGFYSKHKKCSTVSFLTLIMTVQHPEFELKRHFNLVANIWTPNSLPCKMASMISVLWIESLKKFNSEKPFIQRYYNLNVILLFAVQMKKFKKPLSCIYSDIKNRLITAWFLQSFFLTPNSNMLVVETVRSLLSHFRAFSFMT